MSIELPAITQTALSVFDEPRAAIAACRAYCEMTVEKDGITKVTECRVKVKKLRVSLDKRRKEQNEAALLHQRTVNAFAQELIAEVRVIEDHLAKQEEEYQAAKEAARQAKEAERLAMIQSRCDRLSESGCGPADIALVSIMTSERFEEYLSEQVTEAERRREAERLAAEQEAARLAEIARIEEQERVEAERLTEANRLEMERQAEELRKRSEELEAERQRMREQTEEIERQRLQDVARMEAERAEIRREQEQLRREAEERAEAERQRVLAEQRAAEDRKIAEVAEQVKAAEAARLEALRPEIEKAKEFCDAMVVDAKHRLDLLGNPSWGEMALTEMADCLRHITDRVSGDLPF
jgi:hypothetical protein